MGKFIDVIKEFLEKFWKIGFWGRVFVAVIILILVSAYFFKITQVKPDAFLKTIVEMVRPAPTPTPVPKLSFKDCAEKYKTWQTKSQKAFDDLTLDEKIENCKKLEVCDNGESSLQKQKNDKWSEGKLP
jgi:hypothetical protein